MSVYLYPWLYYSTYVFIHIFFTLARLRSAILNIGFDEICTPISKLSFVAISNSKILKPKELTSQVSILLRLILLVSENRKCFQIFVNTHRWWHVDYGDEYILNGTSPIPVNFIKLSPPDHNMTTYLDRWDPHLSDSIIFFNSTSGWKRKNSFSLQPEVDFFDISEVTALICIVCISHKKHTFFNKLSRRRFWVKIYKWPIKVFATNRAFTLLS